MVSGGGCGKFSFPERNFKRWAILKHVRILIGIAEARTCLRVQERGVSAGAASLRRCKRVVDQE